MGKTATTPILRYEVKMGVLVKRFYGEAVLYRWSENEGGLSAFYGSVKSTAPGILCHQVC